MDVNGSRAKPHREVRPGDRIGLAGKDGSRRELVVVGLAERSIPKAAARALYEDVTPPPPPEVVEARRLDRLLAPRKDAGRPDKRDRRDRIRAKRGRVRNRLSPWTSTFSAPAATRASRSTPI